MPHSGALPFTLSRSQDVIGAGEITSTTETVHGLLRLDGDRLVVQWRVARETERVGSQIRTDHEVEPVREAVVPLAALAAAEVRRRWLRKPRLVLTAADLRAFEEIAGEAGLRLEHPAELVLPVRRADLFAAQEFAGELELAVADRALRAAEESAALGAGEAQAPRPALGAGPAPTKSA